MTNSHAHNISAFLLVSGQTGPTQVVCPGGRFTLEDDGDTPDMQNAIIQFPDYPMLIGVRECTQYRDQTRGVIMGQKGTLDIRTTEIIPEPNGEAIRYVPEFQGHPVGGLIYGSDDTTPWMEARAGASRRGETAISASADVEDSMFNLNKRDWINCIKSRNEPFVGLERGNQTAIICNLADMSTELGGRAIQWDPAKEEVIGDPEAAALCRRPYSAPWDGVLRSIVDVDA